MLPTIETKRAEGLLNLSALSSYYLIYLLIPKYYVNLMSQQLHNRYTKH